MSEYTVSQIVFKLKSIVENDPSLIKCTVKGEITNFKGKSKPGHYYFSIKDDTSTINCAMFANYAKSINFDLQNGDKVIITATPSIYNKTGQLQLNVFTLKKEGVGDLLQKYEELKKKLTQQGYFDDAHKKTLDVKYPNNIAVIVGDNSAAMSDIKRTFARRWPLCNVDYYPSIVQGDTAAADIIKNLQLADSKDYEAIIIARGGGSFEDLFCFNDENLVKTIYNLKTFTISGVGHEQDFTLCDFVSDVRASTPTASVELVTPDLEEVITNIELIENNIRTIMQDNVNYLYQSLDNLLIKLNTFSNRMENMAKTIDFSKDKIITILQNKINNIPKELDNSKKQMINSMNNKLQLFSQNLKSKENIIKAHSQDIILKRGYSIIYKNNKIINSSDDLKEKDLIDIRLYKSKAKAEIKEVK